MIGLILTVALRLVGPLAILRWPLAGAILARSLDAIDIGIVDAFGAPTIWNDHYAEFDKALDTYYLVLLAAVAWRWTNPWARLPALALFGYRFVGVVLFEFLGHRELLLVFPNLFEDWWCYAAIAARVMPRLTARSRVTVLVPLALLLVPKLAQEYMLHILRFSPYVWGKVVIEGWLAR